MTAMRVLLLHPHDSPLAGPWSRQRWDLIVDLGKSSQFSAYRWKEHFHCPILRADSFRQGLEDVQRVRHIFSPLRGRLVDGEGIDWWDLTSLLIAAEGIDLSALKHIASELDGPHELWASRYGGPVRMLETLLGHSIPAFGNGTLASAASRAMHYAGLLRRFSLDQLKEIFLDKYDPAYEWRSRTANKPEPCTKPVVLVPSAYSNVSRAASAYARILPNQSFLMIATRESAKKFVPSSNLEIRDLATYAVRKSRATEADSLLKTWFALKDEFASIPELDVLNRAGILDPVAGWIRSGLAVRDAWSEVLQREPVQGVLCGDDTNPYTRLPVLLAARRGIPTVDFHHGAIDGRYMLKELPSDLYMSKNEMERDYLVRICGLPAEKVVIAPLPSEQREADSQAGQSRGTSMIFFSEPYDVGGTRVEEVYGEILPELFRLATSNQRELVVKLHPFESRNQRKRIIANVLGPEAAKAVNIVDGPLTSELLAQAWFGVTVESTTVIDCLQNGVCCFLCGWLSLSPFGYAQQYARFGIGEILDEATQIAQIPERVERFYATAREPMPLSPPVDPAALHEWLTVREPSAVRSAS